MKIVELYRDVLSVVKAVYLSDGKLFYTRTYVLDCNGYVIKDITVYANGIIEIKE